MYLFISSSHLTACDRTEFALWDRLFQLKEATEGSLGDSRQAAETFSCYLVQTLQKVVGDHS